MEKFIMLFFVTIVFVEIIVGLAKTHSLAKRIKKLEDGLDSL